MVPLGDRRRGEVACQRHTASVGTCRQLAIGNPERPWLRDPLPSLKPTLTPMQAGLCDSCKHQKLVRNTRGSVFSMCERSKTDPSYPKYPRLPVRQCAGYVSASR
jgi:hypothetical protein